MTDERRPRLALILAGVAAAVVAVVVVLVLTQQNPPPAAGIARPVATKSPSPHAGLVCPARAVTASGAPFCFALPAHFHDISSIATFVEHDPYRTMIAFDTGSGDAPHDVIVVIARKSAVNFDDFSAADWGAYEHEAVVKVGQDNIVSEGPLRNLHVSGMHAFSYDVTYGTGDHSQLVHLIRGDTIVEVKCQSAHYASQVHTACQSVLASIKIVAL